LKHLQVYHPLYLIDFWRVLTFASKEHPALHNEALLVFTGHFLPKNCPIAYLSRGGPSPVKIRWSVRRTPSLGTCGTSPIWHGKDVRGTGPKGPYVFNFGIKWKSAFHCGELSSVTSGYDTWWALNFLRNCQEDKSMTVKGCKIDSTARAKKLLPDFCNVSCDSTPSYIKAT